MSVNIRVYEICSKEISDDLHNYLFNFNTQKKFLFRYFLNSFVDSSDKKYCDVYIKLKYQDYEHLFKVYSIFKDTVIFPSLVTCTKLYSCIAEHIGIQSPGTSFMVSSDTSKIITYHREPLSFYRSLDEFNFSFSDQKTFNYIIPDNTINNNRLVKCFIKRYASKLKYKTNMIIYKRKIVYNAHNTKKIDKNILNNILTQKGLYNITYKIPNIIITDCNMDMGVINENEYNNNEIFFDKSECMNFLQYFNGIVNEFCVI